jgi:integrase
MSLYRKRRSPFWHFDFWWRGYRFHASTKCTNRREAEKVETVERERAKQHVAQIAAARTSLRLDDIAGRYWTEVGQHHAGATNTEHDLSLLIECPHLGPDKLITEIIGDDVAKLVAWRRGHRSFKPGLKLLSPHTVNHTTEQLRKLFTRAKLWGVRFEHEPRWRDYMLKVPDERVREVSEREAALLATGDDYEPFIAFARASGLRLKECLLKWSEVDWSTRRITKRGKGDKTVTVPITSEIREILWPLRRQHPDFVFTYTPRRKRPGVPEENAGRYPITYAGVQMYWRSLRKRTGIVGLRFHDLRHDFGTKLLRETGNLKLVQKAMNHRDIKTTLRYAHVLDHEVRDGMERAAKSRARSRTFKIVG